MLEDLPVAFTPEERVVTPEAASRHVVYRHENGRGVPAEQRRPSQDDAGSGTGASGERGRAGQPISPT
jgi:hypothetical protein